MNKLKYQFFISTYSSSSYIEITLQRISWEALLYSIVDTIKKMLGKEAKEEYNINPDLQSYRFASSSTAFNIQEFERMLYENIPNIIEGSFDLQCENSFGFYIITIIFDEHVIPKINCVPHQDQKTKRKYNDPLQNSKFSPENNLIPSEVWKIG